MLPISRRCNHLQPRWQQWRGVDVRVVRVVGGFTEAATDARSISSTVRTRPHHHLLHRVTPIPSLSWRTIGRVRYASIVAANNCGTLRVLGGHQTVIHLPQSRWRSSSRNSQSTENIVFMAAHHLGSMSPEDISAYWSLILQCIKKNHRSKNQEQEEHQQQQEMMNSILSRTMDCFIARQNEFNAKDIAIFLQKYIATMGHDLDSRLFSSLEAGVMAKCFSKCNSQDLPNIAWAFAVANVEAGHVFCNDSAFTNACIRMRHKLTVEGLSQLHQWHLWQRELKSNVALPPSLQLKCYKAFITRLPRPSALQNDVVHELSSIGLTPKEEVLTKSGYLLDALVEVNGRKIAIEVDGPFHFVGKNPKSRTVLKRRQVACIEGIPVVSVPFWDWNKHRKDRSKKQQYLRALLGLGSSRSKPYRAPPVQKETLSRCSPPSEPRSLARRSSVPLTDVMARFSKGIPPVIFKSVPSQGDTG